MHHARRMGALAALALALAGLPWLARVVAAEPPAAVEIVPADYREVRASILASGRLLYEQQVQLSPEVIGRVAAIHVREGQRVRQGDLLIRLDDHEYRAEVAQQQAALQQQRIAIEQRELALGNQRSQYRRKLELHGKGMIADAQIDDARYALDLAEVELRTSRAQLAQVRAVLAQAEERLARTVIRAPLEGSVTALDIKVGETAVASQVGIAGSTLLTIANTATLVAEIGVDEADIGGVARGQAVTLHTAAYQDVAIAATVAAISLSPRQGAAAVPGAAPARHYAVRVALADTGALALRPGMSCRAEIFATPAARALAVPVQAVLTEGFDRVGGAAASASYVYVSRGGRAEKRRVTTGTADDSLQQIVRGLAAGDAVITGPYKVLRQLRDGDPVAPRGREGGRT